MFRQQLSSPHPPIMDGANRVVLSPLRSRFRSPPSSSLDGRFGLEMLAENRISGFPVIDNDWISTFNKVQKLLCKTKWQSGWRFDDHGLSCSPINY